MVDIAYQEVRGYTQFQGLAAQIQPLLFDWDLVFYRRMSVLVSEGSSKALISPKGRV